MRTRIRTIIRLNRFRKLQQALSLLQDAYAATLEGWVRAVDLREHELEGHSQRVAEMTVRLARALRIEPDELVHIHRGALLHDIGKIAIPDAILRKAGPLSESEWEIMRRHPEYARSMLEPIAYLRPALQIPYCHHERWDGKGYPRGLKGKEIPRAARIFTVVDVWDALISDRPYRLGWEGERVRSYLRENAGVIFDPEVVTTFLELLGSEELVASDMPIAAPPAAPAVGVGSDVVHAGLDDLRDRAIGEWCDLREQPGPGLVARLDVVPGKPAALQGASCFAPSPGNLPPTVQGRGWESLAILVFKLNELGQWSAQDIGDE